MRSVRNIAHPEELPEIGSREAAVESCASLIAGMAGQPEAVMHYWLDLYYQVRLAYEQENGDEAPVLIRAEELLPALRRLWNEVLGVTTTEGEAQDAEKEAPAPEAPAEGEAAGSAEAGEEAGAERSAPPPREPPGELTGFEPVKPKAKGNPAPKGNTYGADAAAFKRETAQRLRDARKAGLTLGRIVALSKGKLTDNTVMDILDAKRVPIETYRVLAKALDKAEAETT